MTDLSSHLVLMFISHCPDRELALVLKSKPSCEWTAREVQDHLDEYLREHMVGRGCVTQNVVTVELSKEKVAVTEQAVSSNAGYVPEPERSPSVSDHNTVDRVLSLLERALTSNTQSMGSRLNWQGSKHPRECQICGSSQHNTRSHCRMHKLCVQCYSPEHISVNCDQSQTTQKQPTGQGWSDPPQGN